jgi:HEAT repeat protein
MPDLRVPSDVDELLEQLRSPLRDVRLAAAVALDDVAATEKIEQALRDAARDPDAQVRRAAMHSLSCAHCKPDGCLGPAAVDVLVDALLHDPSIRNRRWAAGVTMWSQVGASRALVAAYREVLASSSDRVLRERAATFLASLELPRGDRPYQEWLAVWEPLKDALLAS